jgi:crotonobetainyl-CoA:carnitine CoA-transferase CaiB-like acyl-CoA transferase
MCSNSNKLYKAGVAIIDLLTGVHAFSAIMAALLNREKNGTGEL